MNGEDIVSEDLDNKDELIGVETRRMYKPLQLLTLRFSYGGLCEYKHTPGAHTQPPLTYTNVHHPHLFIYTHTCKGTISKSAVQTGWVSHTVESDIY